jgi:hypothetical protein
MQQKQGVGVEGGERYERANHPHRHGLKVVVWNGHNHITVSRNEHAQATRRV